MKIYGIGTSGSDYYCKNFFSSEEKALEIVKWWTNGDVKKLRGQKIWQTSKGETFAIKEYEIDALLRVLPKSALSEKAQK